MGDVCEAEEEPDGQKEEEGSGNLGVVAENVYEVVWEEQEEDAAETGGSCAYEFLGYGEEEGELGCAQEDV
jgi:hypothetical protein